MGYIAAAIVGGAAISAIGESQNSRRQIAARNAAIAESNRRREALFNDALRGDFLGQFGTEDIFGSVPEHAAFETIDLDQALIDNIAGNAAALPAASDLSSRINEDNLAQDFNRIRAFDANFDNNIGQISGVTNDLLNMRLPFQDVLDIVSDRQELSGALGTPGGATNATLADLGLSRLDAFREGVNTFQGMVSAANAISPVQNQSRVRDFFLSPVERIQQQTTQNILDQQSRQSAFNLAASADPAAAQLFNAETAAQLQNVQAALGTAGQINNGLSTLGSGVQTAALAYGQQQNNQAQQAYLNQLARQSSGNTSGVGGV